MRKALIGLLMVATAATPLATTAASAQSNDRERARAAERYQRLEQRNQQRFGNTQTQAPRPQAQRQRAAPPQANPPAAVAQRGERGQRPDRGQRQGWQGRGEAQAGQQRNRGERPGRVRQPTPQQQVEWQGNPNNPRHEAARQRYQQLERQNQRNYGNDRRWQDRRGDNRWNQRDDRRWDRGWRNNNRYDWQRYRYSNRNLYRAPAYYAPYRGHSYSRFSIGIMLGAPFYHQRYWLTDPYQYRLPMAPAGYQWVRYYNDVLLVDTWSGEVVDVIYDFFW